MAPSIAEAPSSEIVVPVKADLDKTSSSKPKIRRVIDEEGENTTASVCSVTAQVL